MGAGGRSCADRATPLRIRRECEHGLDELLGREVSGVEVVVEGISEAFFGELRAGATRAVSQGSRFLFEFSDEAQAEKAVDSVRNANGRLRSLVPRRRSLEELMVAGMERERQR